MFTGVRGLRYRRNKQVLLGNWSFVMEKSCRKDCPTASVLLEAKAAALHPERYQSSRGSPSGGSDQLPQGMLRAHNRFVDPEPVSLTHKFQVAILLGAHELSLNGGGNVCRKWRPLSGRSIRFVDNQPTDRPCSLEKGML
jgi:hypothetical protein